MLAQDDPREHRDTPPMPGVALHASSLAHLAAGRPCQALAAARTAVEAFADREGWQHPDTANALVAVSRAAALAGALDEAAAAARQALAILAPLPADGPLARIRIQAACAAGDAHRRAGRYEVAAELLRQAAGDAQRWLGQHDPDLALACNGIGLVERYRGSLDAAERWYQRALDALGPGDDLDVAAVLHNLAGLDHARGRSADALAHAERAWEIRCARLGAEHPDALADRAQIGEILRCCGRLEPAAEVLNAVLERWIALRGPDDLEVAVAHHNLSLVAVDRGALEDAIVHGRAALRTKELVLGPGHPELAITLHNLAVALRDHGDHGAARAALDRAIALLERAEVAASHPTLGACRRARAGL